MTLHIYAQSYEHQDAFVVGTREDLENLQSQIEAALRGPYEGPLCEEYYAGDGEGYHLFVVPVQEGTELQLPYKDPIGEDFGQHPIDVISISRYRQLVKEARNRCR